MMEEQFKDIVNFIQQSRVNALKAVNSELINLYWNVGAYISERIKLANWGEKTVDELAEFINKNHPDIKGFNRRGLYRMKQFYETYRSAAIMSPLVTQSQITDNKGAIIVSPVVTQLKGRKKQNAAIETTFGLIDIRKSVLAQISWTAHLIIFSRCKIEEEREFYLRLTISENYSKRELDRQISAGLFERVMIGNKKISASIKETHPNILNNFKDSYVFEFLNLPEFHSEDDLQKALVRQMRKFILELGKDYIFISEEYKIQVGNRDFSMDLLFYHRGLQCLVAFELKKERFEPEYLGKVNFYLEALDRDVKKPNENPSIGILLCKDNDKDVVEYALNRSMSPTMIAEYKTQLPDKKLLQQKLHELFENNIEGSQ